jgi:hypothetical protein
MGWKGITFLYWATYFIGGYLFCSISSCDLRWVDRPHFQLSLSSKESCLSLNWPGAGKDKWSFVYLQWSFYFSSFIQSPFRGVCKVGLNRIFTYLRSSIYLHRASYNHNFRSISFPYQIIAFMLRPYRFFFVLLLGIIFNKYFIIFK